MASWSKRAVRGLAVLGLVLGTATAQADLLGGVSDGLAKARENLNKDMQAWSDALAGDLAAYRTLLAQFGGNYLIPTPGTTSAEGFIQWQGLARRYIVILPAVLKPNSPAILVLHPKDLAPEKTGNLTRAGRLAATYGAVVFLPEGQGGQWNEDPSANASADDVGFLGSLISYAVSHYGVNAKRVYATGYSSGGFMSARLGCQLSQKIAGVGEVAATMRGSLKQICAPTHAMPAAIIAGTSDTIVPYNGILQALSSAPDAAAMWATKATCSATTVFTHMPNLNPADGTTVDLTRYPTCAAATEVRLYTVNGGGHTWPGSPYALYTAQLGRTSQDLDATIELWKFLSVYSLP